jgi:hypothetical protein
MDGPCRARDGADEEEDEETGPENGASFGHGFLGRLVWVSMRRKVLGAGLSYFSCVLILASMLGPTLQDQFLSVGLIAQSFPMDLSLVTPTQETGVRIWPFNPDIIMIDSRTVPPLVYAVDNITLAKTLSNLSDGAMQELLLLANMTYEERQAYFDSIAMEAEAKQNSSAPA